MKSKVNIINSAIKKNNLRVNERWYSNKGKQIMDKKFKIKLIGVAITGGGLILTPFTMNKYIIVLNYLLFIYFCFSALAFDMKQRNFTVEDFTSEIDKRSYKSFKDKKYGAFTLYTITIPMMILGLLTLVGIIIVTLKS